MKQEKNIPHWEGGGGGGFEQNYCYVPNLMKLPDGILGDEHISHVLAGEGYLLW